MIEFVGITKIFNTDLLKKDEVALDNVSFKVHKQKITGLIGLNGAGKTTLIKILMGFITPTSGKILINGHEKLDKFELKNVGYLPERPYLYDFLTGREFLNYMGLLNGLSQSQIKENGEYWANRMDIFKALDRSLKNYSKGMLQRLGFVSCLMHKPTFLILDEPLSGLDPIGRQLFKDIFLEVHTQGTGIFFSSHILHDVEELSSDIVIINKGKLFFNGGIKDLLNEDNSLLKLTYFTKEKIEFGKVLTSYRVDGDKEIITSLISQSELSEAIKKIGENNLLELNRNKETLENIFERIKQHEC